MPIVKSNGIDIAYEIRGDEDKPVLLLVHGLSMSIVAWPPALLRRLREAGYRLLMFDNRDMGHSQKMNNLDTPNFALQLIKRKLGLSVSSPYTLNDMADDTIGLLDELHIKKVHVLGVSMGGMISQLLAINYPERVKTLTSIMSTTGKRGLPSATSDVRNHLLSKPESSSLEDKINFGVKTWKLIGSPEYPNDQETLEIFIKSLIERGMPSSGTLRQMLAIAAAKGRNDDLAQIQTPSLIIHGNDDPLVPVECGIDTAEAIPNSYLEIIPGMGHDLPMQLLPQICDRIIQHLESNQ